MRQNPPRLAAILAFVLIAAHLPLVLAAPYPPDGLPVEFRQPDGTSQKLRVFGDEFYARTETEDGYTVVRNPADNSYHYAKLSEDGSRLVPSGHRVNGNPPAGLGKKLDLPPQARQEAWQKRHDLLAPNERKEWAQRVDAARQRREQAKPGQQADPGLQPGAADGTATGATAPEVASASFAAVTGNYVGLTILVQFPDDPATTTTVDPTNFPTTKAAMQDYCNLLGYTGGGNSGSVRDYFRDQSLNQTDYTQLVTDIVTMPQPRNYYNWLDYPTNTVLRDGGLTGRLVLNDALTVLKNQGFNFAGCTLNGSNQIIATNVIFAGNTSGVWPDGLWPHRWALSPSVNVGTTQNPMYVYDYQITNAASASVPIGTFCHENGHLLLKYPDLYDYDGDSEGVGNHCLMGAGNHLNNGKTPGPINGYFKDVVGWSSVVDVTAAQVFTGALSTTGNGGYRIRKPGTATEYFLIENRGTGDKWATYSPDKGILVWHIDEVVNGNNYQQMTQSQHYEVSLEQADGTFDLENNRDRGDSLDAFDSTHTAGFNDTTLPNAKWWDGSNSGIYLKFLSAAGASMNVDFGLPTNTVQVGYPNGGETIFFGATKTITWNANITGNVKIELMNGAAVQSVLSANEANDGTYSWTVSAGLPAGSNYKIKVTSVNNSVYSDSSDAAFTIGAQPTLADALDTTGIAWTTSGNGNWYSQVATTHDGIDAAQSGVILANQTSTLETTFTQSGTLTFWWRVSSETSYDWLELYVNGVLQTGANARISGAPAWAQKTVSVPSGTTTVRWTYRKDGSVDANSDCGWVDEVVFTPDTAGPEITVEQPLGTSLTDGSSTVDFGSSNVGVAAPVKTFTIRNDGTTNLTGLTLSKTGGNAADFTLSALTVTTLAPAASTTFTVTFTPSATGNRTTTLQIGSNDSNENPFDINLAGVGAGPAALTVTSSSNLVSSGLEGGPYAPNSIQYTLTNTGGSSLNWTASNTKTWVTVSPAAGTLAAGAATTVTVSINTQANNLTPGSYSDTVSFTNTTNNVGDTTRSVSLGVTGLWTLWEEDFDPDTALPGGWTLGNSAGSAPWILSMSNGNNQAHCYSAPVPTTKVTSHLITPNIAVPAAATMVQVRFWQNYNLQAGKDGGRLQLSLDGGAWYEVDDVGSGASFSAGGYNTSISGNGNPNNRSDYDGKTVWSGSSGGYILATLDLDAATYKNHNVRLRWTVATDSSTASSFWYLDDILVVTDAAPTFTIAYNGNSNTGGSVPGNQTKTGGVALTLATNAGNLVKTNNGFAGWNTQNDGNGVSYAPGGTFTADANTTLYAKWNGTPVSNAGNDQSVNLVAGGGPWTPADITTALWLDASDTSTITLNGGVFQWADKSTNNRHATQSTAAAQPTSTANGLNSLNVLSFDGSTDFLNVNLDFLSGVSHSAFIVTSGVTGYTDIYGAANGNSGANSIHCGFASSTKYRMNYWAHDFGPNVTTNFLASGSILNYVWNVGSPKQIYANGKSEGSNGTTAALAPGAPAGGGRISNVVGHGYYGGKIAEIVFLTGVVSATDREKMEGFLAHKWGLAGNLPSGHTYANDAPGGSGASVDVDLSSANVTDPESDSTTVTWSVVSTVPSGLGGSVSFDNANMVDATATFTQEGVYTLRLTASDGYSSRSDDVVITVGPALSPYQIWAQGVFAHSFSVTDANSDPDGDGWLNFVEFALGTDPTDGGNRKMVYSAGGSITTAGAPIVEGPGGGYKAVFSRRKDHATAGLTYTAQFSADMSSWTASSTGLTVVTGAGSSGNYEAVRVPFPATVPLQAGGSAPPKFFRVDVTMN